MTTTLNIMRHESVFNPSQHTYPIHIIGAGATGSHVFASLVNLGITKMSVYDFDQVADHNLANQIYTARDVGTAKVDACKTYYCNKLNVSTPPETMQFHNVQVSVDMIERNLHDICSGIVFLLTDTMLSRKNLFNALASPLRATKPLLIIETRMASTHGHVFTINPYDKQQIKDWRSTLVDDTNPDNIEVSPCGTALSVGPTAAIIANYAVWQLLQFYVSPLSIQPRIDLFLKPTLTVTSPAIAEAA